MLEHESNVRHEEPMGPHPLLRDLVVEAAFTAGRAVIDNSIESIYLGVFEKEAEEMGMQCFLEDRLMGKVIYVNGRDKLLVPKKPFKGEGSFISMMGEASLMSKEEARRNKSRDRYPIMTITTDSRVNGWFDYQSLGFLLVSDRFPLASSCLMMICKDSNHIIMRGENSPQLSESEMYEKMHVWVTQFKERLKQHTSPEMTDAERIGISERVSWALIKQICSRYDLSLFSSEAGSDITTRQDTGFAKLKP